MDDFKTFQEGMMEKKRTAQVSKDASTITKYLSDNKITAQQDTSGLRYVLHTNKGGSKPTVEQLCRGKIPRKIFKRWKGI